MTTSCRINYTAFEESRIARLDEAAREVLDLFRYKPACASASGSTSLANGSNDSLNNRRFVFDELTSLCGPVFLRSVSLCWRIYPIERHDLTKPHLGHFSVPTAIATGNFLAFEHFPGLDL